MVKCHIQDSGVEGGSYPYAENQSEYSTTPADWDKNFDMYDKPLINNTIGLHFNIGPLKYWLLCWGRNGGFL